MTVVVSGKKLVATGAKTWPGSGSTSRRIGSRDSIDLIGLDLRASYARIYASQPMIFSLVNKLARGIARLPLRSYEWIDEDTNESRPAATSPLGLTLKKPWPRGSRRALVEWLVGSVAVYGHGYAWKYRPGPGRPPAELWPLDPRGVTLVTGTDAPVAHYEYRVGDAVRRILPEDMIHLRWWSPVGERGTSPLEALRVTLALEDAGRRYAISSFANGVRPSGALVHPKTLHGEDRKELQAEIDEIHSGPDNAFRMLLLDGGLDWKSFSHSAQEAQTIEHRKLNQIEACQVYDIPPPVVQILDKATFSNITEQNVALYRESLAPWFSLIEDEFEAQLIRDEPLFDGSYVKFDLRDVLRAMLGERADAYMKLLSIYTPNEIRGLEGLPPIDHPAANTILLPLNMQPLGEEPLVPAETIAAASMIYTALTNDDVGRATRALDSLSGAGRNGHE